MPFAISVNNWNLLKLFCFLIQEKDNLCLVLSIQIFYVLPYRWAAGQHQIRIDVWLRWSTGRKQRLGIHLVNVNVKNTPPSRKILCKLKIYDKASSNDEHIFVPKLRLQGHILFRRFLFLKVDYKIIIAIYSPSSLMLDIQNNEKSEH